MTTINILISAIVHLPNYFPEPQLEYKADEDRVLGLFSIIFLGTNAVHRTSFEGGLFDAQVTSISWNNLSEVTGQ
jgi:hypothetical protein